MTEKNFQGRMVFCSFKSDYIQQTFGKVSAYRAESMPDYPVSK